MEWSPSFTRIARPDGDGHVYRVGHPVVDEFLEFVAGRARPNTVRAYAHDLKVFFAVVDKEPAEVTPGGRDGVRDRAAPPAAGRREGGAHL